MSMSLKDEENFSFFGLMSWLSKYTQYLIYPPPFQKVVTRIQIMQHLTLEITVWKLHREGGLCWLLYGFFKSKSNICMNSNWLTTEY